MPPELEREYQATIRAAVLQNGYVVDTLPSFGWMDHPATTHLRACGGYTPRFTEVHEDEWYEFVSMGDGNEPAKHGMALDDVSCPCGQIKSRKVRWDAYPSEMIETVFQMAKGRR